MSEIEKKLSKVEKMKVDSKYLKGDIVADLTSDAVDVSDYTYEMLKFHGSYFGYDRDSATKLKKQGLDKLYEFMVRLRIPAGKMTSEQYRIADDLAEQYANGTIKITTRQTFQFHCIEKPDMIPFIGGINEAGMSTLSACGDVVRNVMATNAPYSGAKYTKLMDDTYRIVDMCAPKTSAYKEVWTGQKDSNRNEENPLNVEPLYGDTYLPRKFKIGLVLPEDNGLDVFSHDLGFVLVYEGDEFKGYNVVVGGGMGMKHNKPKTYARAATDLAFVGKNDLLNAVEAVVKLQRDNGDRGDRQHARLKYVVEENGYEWTRKTFEEYFNATNPSEPAKDSVKIDGYTIPDYMGWREQGDGKYFVGVPVPSGRIVDYDTNNKTGYTDNVSDKFKSAKYRSAFREITDSFNVKITLTADQNIVFCDIAERDKEKIDNILKSNNIPSRSEFSNFERFFMSCVSLPTCGKALSEAERVQFTVMEDIQSVLNDLDIADEKLSVRVTGCPNGCARPSLGDIGIIGRMPGAYVIHIGGDFEGTRLNIKVLDKVPQAEIGNALRPMLEKFVAERNGNEGFGDFCHRAGVENVAKTTEDALGEENKWAKVVL